MATGPNLKFGDLERDWVIVDYKTDDTESNAIEALAAHYAGQLDAYQEAWTESTGEEVKERAFFFTHASRLYPLSSK